MDKNFLHPEQLFFIVKVAGENDSEDKDFFVAHNRSYDDVVAAATAAKDLAEKTTGNRYYVVASVLGCMTHPPKKEFLVYQQG